MPTNNASDRILNSINNAPIFTYGMITITALVLAYVTLTEKPEIDVDDDVYNPLEEAGAATGNPVSELAPPNMEETSSPEESSTEGESKEESKEEKEGETEGESEEKKEGETEGEAEEKKEGETEGEVEEKKEGETEEKPPAAGVETPKEETAGEKKTGGKKTRMHKSSRSKRTTKRHK